MEFFIMLEALDAYIFMHFYSFACQKQKRDERALRSISEKAKKSWEKSETKRAREMHFECSSLLMEELLLNVGADFCFENGKRITILLKCKCFMQWQRAVRES